MAVQELLIRLGLEHASFQKKMKGVNKEIDILDKNFEGLMAEMKDFDKTQAGLTAKTEHFKKKIELLEGALKECAIAQNKLETESKELKVSMGQMEKELTQVRSSLDKQVEGAKLVSQQYAQVQSSIKKLSGIEKVFEQANTSIQKHNQNIDRSSKTYKGLEATIKKNNASIKDYQQVNKVLDNTIVSVCKSLNLNEKEVKETIVQYSKTEAKLKSLSAQYDKLSATYGKNSAEAIKIRSEMDKFSNTAKRQSAIISALPKDVQDLSRAYGQTEAKINALQTANKNMITVQTKVKNSIKESKEEIKRQEQAFEEAKAALKKYGIEATSIEDGIKKVKLALTQERSALRESAESMEAYTKRIGDLKKTEISLQQQLDKSKKKFESYQRQMQDVSKVSAETTKEINKMKNGIKEAIIDMDFTKLNANADYFNKLGNSLTTFGNQVTSFGRTATYGLSVPIASFGALAMKTFTSFEERIRKVNAVFGSTGTSMESQFTTLSESARHFGRTTEWTSQQVGEAYEYMAMAGWTVEQSTKAMSPMLDLASIGMVDLGLATDIVTDTMTPFSKHLDKVGQQAKASGKEFNEAQYMVDIFSTTISSSNTNVELMGETFKYSAGVMASYGVDMKDLAFATGIFANAGQKGSRAGTQLSTGLNRLNKPTKQAREVMDKYGLSIQTTSDGSVDLMKTFEHLRGKLGHLSATQKGAIMTTIFGQQAQRGWISILNASTEEWDKMTKAMENTEGATERMMEEIEKSGAYSFKILISAITDLLIVVGDALAPAMKELTQWLTKISTKISEWVTRMRETNPELLSLVGKLGLAAVVVPPLVMGIGLLVTGMGSLFTGTGKTIKAFTTFAKDTKMVARGVTATNRNVGFFAKGLGKLITKFGGIKVAMLAAIPILGTMAISVGKNEKALASLQEKFGIFGFVIGGYCEALSGRFTMVFGNLMHLLSGVGKSINALLTGKWNEIDDIWRETWGKMENTTAKAMSNIAMESTKAVSKIKNLTIDELNGVEKAFETVYGKISTLTRDNHKDIAKDLSSVTKNLSQDSLTILRGTSDTMAVLFDQIHAGMSDDRATKQLAENLKGMASSGEYSADKIASDFKKAFNLIRDGAKDSANQVGKEVNQITKYIGKVAQDGVDNVAINIASTIGKMDEVTYETMKNMGGTWQQLFAGVELGSSNMSGQIVTNLKNMGGDYGAIIKALTEESKKGFDETGKAIEQSGQKAGETAQKTGEAFATMTNLIKTNSSKSMKEVSTVFANGLKTLDLKTIEQLRNTSDAWYSILDGTTDSSGKLVDNFSQQILWNLGWVSQQSPEKLKGFENSLLTALVNANIITQDQMNGIVQKVGTKGQEAIKGSEGTGKKVAENVTPQGADEKVKEELDKVTTSINEKTVAVSEASAKAGEDAQKKFDEKVSAIGKDIVIDGAIIDVEYLGTQFTNAGSLAVVKFVEGWNFNKQLITQAIDLALQTVTGDLTSTFAGINVQFDGLVQKSAILKTETGGLKESIASLNSIPLNNLYETINSTKKALKEVETSSKNARSSIVQLGITSVSNVNSGLGSVDKKLKDIKTSSSQAGAEIIKLNTRTFSSVNGQMDKFKATTDKTKKAVEQLIKTTEKFIGLKFTTMNTSLESIKTKLDQAKSKVSDLKTLLTSLNSITFGNLLSRLASIRTSLDNVRWGADITAYAISKVKTRSVSEGDGSVDALNLINKNIVSMARDNVNITKYQTSGGFYSPNSYKRTSEQSRQLKQQDEQLTILRQQNELLKALILSTNNIGGDINLSVEMDGRQVARSTARYMEKEITTLNKRKSRLGVG